MAYKKKFKIWLPSLIWMITIFIFSNQPINKPGVSFSWIDFIFKKICHFGEYTILYLLIFKATGKKSIIKPLILTLLYALTDEWHQTFIPGREGTLRDVGFDAFGAVLGLILAKREL